MKTIRLVLTSSFLLMLVLLSACNLPVNQAPTQDSPNAVFTAAAQTVEAQLTQNALLVPASATSALAAATLPPLPTIAALDPLPVNTPLPAPQATTQPPPDGTVSPTPLCDAAQFVADVTVPDGTKYAPGETFVKTWRLKNTGACTWDSTYSLVFDSGDAMGGPGSLALTGTVTPGQQVDLSVTLKAPAAVDTYRGYWRLRNAAGAFLPVTGGYGNKSFYVEIQVKQGAASSENAKFQVSSVAFNTTHTGSCTAGKYTVTATITVNKAGTVTYTWIRSDGATGAANSGSLEFSDAASLPLEFEWTTGATGLWVDLYIDNPNHQQFGRALLNCP